MEIFGQLGFIATNIIIQYEFSGTMLDLFKVQYIFHQMWVLASAECAIKKL